MVVLCMFREPSLGRHVHRALMRNALLDLTPILLATACHQRNYVETYSRFIEGMMAIENRPEQGFYSTATPEDMRGVWRAEGIDERSYIELADDPQHQRQVRHRADLMNGNGPEVPLLQSF
jgi:hypothetical protein